MKAEDFEGLPDRVLNEFACDCAWRALEREREAGREPVPCLWQAVRTKRAWIEGRAADEDLKRTRDDAFSAARVTAASAASAYASAYGAAYASLSDAVWAFNSAVAWSAGGFTEEAWQEQHFSSLLEKYALRSALLSLLLARQEALSKQAAVQVWQHEGEAALFF